MEDDLIILVIEPEEVGLAGLVEFGHPDCHGVFVCLAQSALLHLDYLFVAESILVDLLLCAQFPLVVGDDLVLFDKFIRHCSCIYQLIFLPDQVQIPEPLEGLVGDHDSGIIEFHADGVGVQHVSSPEFAIFLEECHPDEGRLLRRHLNRFWLGPACSGNL